MKKEYTEITAPEIKSNVLILMNWFRRTYNAQPRYVMLSETQYNLLKCDMSVYHYQEFKEHFFGMEICVSERVKTLDDIQLF